MNHSPALAVHVMETPTLGDRSYLAATDGWAVAIDVQRDLDRVERLLEEHSLRLAAVLETHIHNDYVSGGLALARRHRAEYVVPAGPRLGFTARRAADGDCLEAGGMRVRVIATPGHTDAHAVFAMSRGGTCTVAFTGGSLLLGGSGRTDLLGPDLAEDLARRQYRSIRRLVDELPDEAMLYPTHGFGSFCAARPATGGGATLREQRSVNAAFQVTEDAFVAEMLEGYGPFPSYYAFMGPRNAGAPTEARLDVPVLTDAQGIARAADEDPRLHILDVRSRRAWAEAHLAGSLHAAADGPQATWLGWVLPVDTPLALVADDADGLAASVRELARIGFDDIEVACVSPDLRAEVPTRHTRRATFAELRREMEDGTRPLVLDVREDSEWREGHLPGALHVPVHALAQAPLPPHTSIWVHCAAGYRAGLAVSLLERRGCTAVWIDDSLSEPAA